MVRSAAPHLTHSARRVGGNQPQAPDEFVRGLWRLRKVRTMTRLRDDRGAPGDDAGRGCPAPHRPRPQRGGSPRPGRTDHPGRSHAPTSCSHASCPGSPRCFRLPSRCRWPRSRRRPPCRTARWSTERPPASRPRPSDWRPRSRTSSAMRSWRCTQSTPEATLGSRGRTPLTSGARFGTRCVPPARNVSRRRPAGRSTHGGTASLPRQSPALPARDLPWRSLARKPAPCSA